MLGKKVDLNNKEKVDNIVKHYSNVLYKRLSPYNTVLNDKDFKFYTEEQIKFFVYNYGEKWGDLRSNLNSRIYSMVNYQKHNNEYIMEKYIQYVGINKDILFYYSEKYKFLLEEYNNTRFYLSLKNNYVKIIKEVLLKNNLYIINVESNIREELKHYSYKYINEEVKVLKSNKRIENKEDIYSNYLYYKDIMFDKYKDKLTISNSKLKQIIDERYDMYFNAYIYGKSNRTFSRYFNTRLGDYLKMYMKDYIPKENYVDDNIKEKHPKIK